MNDTWPLWDPTDVLALVQFVSRKAIAPADLQPPPGVVYNEANVEEGRNIARALYEKLAKCGIPYAHEEWSPGTTQLVRPAAEMRQSKGTCVDLAVAYAAMCWDAQLRPLLALGGPRDARHVLVVIDLSATRNDAPAAPDSPFVVLPEGAVAVEDLRGLPDHVIAVDIAAATRDSGRGFDQAIAQGERWLLDTNNGVKLADVRLSRERGLPDSPELPAPDLDWIPPIHTRLKPPAGEFDSFPSRAGVERDLAKASGIVVVLGESGMGKSLLAYHGKAASAAHGYGWTLTASDAKTLQTELAHAELSERNAPGDETLFDRTVFKEAALARLQQSKAPWVVVLDNADGPPSQLSALIPRPRLGQTLVITTTNPAWASPSEWAHDQHVTVLRLEPLSPEESGVQLPAWAEQALAGNPQLLGTVAKAVRFGGGLGDKRAVSGAELAWDTALDAVQDSQARSVATLLGWLPAAPISVDHLEALHIQNAAAVLQELSRAGLVTATAGDAVQMHRLFRDVAREASGNRAVEQVDLILSSDPLREFIFTQNDEALIGAYAKELGSNTQASVNALLGMARVLEYRGQVKESAEWFQRALDAGDPAPEAWADCLQGRARWVNQNKHARPEEIALARGWIAQIAEILDTNEPRQHLRFQRARAIDGLLLRKLANAEDDPQERRRKLEDARAILQDSLDQRLAIVAGLDEDTDDKDRGLFNLAGTDMALAKISDWDESARCFTEARKAYLEALEIRRARYGDLSIPHIASCTAGLAMVDYNQAMRTVELSDDLDEKQQVSVVGLLRTATSEMALALVQRNEFDGPADSKNDTQKSLDFLIKILLLRKAVAGDSTHPDSDQAKEEWEASVAAFRKEWGHL